MKHHSLLPLLVLFALLLAQSLRAQQTITYLDEDFQQTTGSALPAGWDNSVYQTTASAPANYIWRANTGGYYPAGGSSTGQRCAYLFTATSTTYAVLKSPEVTLSATRGSVLRFRLKNGTNGASDLDVYVSTDGGATYQTNPIAQHLRAGNTWRDYEFALPSAFNGQSIRIVFYGRKDATSTYYYLDDITLESAPTCQAPDGMYINGLTLSSATLYWGLKGAGFGVVPDSFLVELRDAAGATVVSGSQPGTQMSYSFTGLAASSRYTARVKSNCDPAFQGFSDWTELDFTTLSPAVALPYHQAFDSLTALPEGSYGVNASINTTSTYCMGLRGKSLKLAPTTSDQAYFITPQIDGRADSIETEFQVRRYSTSYAMTYSVGYVTDPSDIASTFVLMMEDTLSEGTAWKNVRCNAALTTGAPRPVMICILVGSGTASSIYIDDLDIHTLPSCLRPERLTVEAVTAHTATLSWRGTQAAGVLIRATDTDHSTVVEAMATGSPFTITGLTADADYSFTAQAVCAPGDSSSVAPAVASHTLCGVADSVAMAEDFNSLPTNGTVPHCWQAGWLDRGLSTVTTPFTASTGFKHGTAGASMSLRSQPVGTRSYLSTPALPVDEAYKYRVSLWVYRANASSYRDEGIRLWVNTVPDDTAGGVCLGYIHRHYQYSPAETASAAWYQYEYPIPMAGNVYILIEGVSENGSSTYFDDFRVDAAPSCFRVTEVALDSVTGTGALVGWTPGHGNTAWAVDYSLERAGVPVCDTTVIVTAPQLRLTGLASSSGYSLAGQVRAICGPGDTAEAVPFAYDFATECVAITELPYTCGFEAAESTAGTRPLPLCWGRLTNVTSTTYMHPYCYANTNARTGARVLYLYQTTGTNYADNPMAVLPEINTAALPMAGLRLSFYARLSYAPSSSYGTGRVIVGVMTDPEDSTTFVDIDTVDITANVYARHQVIFSGYSGPARHMALRFPRPAAKYNYVLIDDLVIDPIPECIELEGAATVSDIADTAARISIDDATARSGWSYAYGPAGAEVSSLAPVDTAGASVLLTGLAANTAYDLYVRRICPDNEHSPWAGPVHFTTAVTPRALPYVTGFEDEADNREWQFANATGVNNLIIGTDSGAVLAGSRALYVTNNGQDYSYSQASASQAYAYRTLRFEDRVYTVSFRWKATGGESTYDWGRALLVPGASSSWAAPARTTPASPSPHIIAHSTPRARTT